MIVQVVTLFICAAVGFAFGGPWGAAGLLLLWAGVLFASGLLRGRREPPSADGAEQGQASVYANIDAVNDRLEDVARERRWSLEKRFEIARIACENPSVPFGKLETLYDRGFRAAPDTTRSEDIARRENPGPS